MDSVCPTGGVDQSLTAAGLRRLRGFREEAFGCLGRRRDALFELVDGLLAAESMPSLPHVSLPPVHRRAGAACMPRWPSAKLTPNGSSGCWPRRRPG